MKNPEWVGNLKKGALISTRAWKCCYDARLITRGDGITDIKRKLQEAIDAGRLRFQYGQVRLDCHQINNAGKTTWLEFLKLADRTETDICCPHCGRAYTVIALSVQTAPEMRLKP